MGVLVNCILKNNKEGESMFNIKSYLKIPKKSLLLLMLLLSLLLISCTKQNTLKIGNLEDFIYLDSDNNISTFNLEKDKSSVFIDIDKAISEFHISRDNKILAVQIPGGSNELNYSEEGPLVVIIDLIERKMIKRITKSTLSGISPDNDVLFLDYNDRKVNQLKAFDTEAKKVINFKLGNYSDIYWSLDGNKIAYTEYRNGLMKVFIEDLISSKKNELLPSIKRNKIHPRWANSGEIIFISYTDDIFYINSTIPTKNSIGIILKTNFIIGNPLCVRIVVVRSKNCV